MTQLLATALQSKRWIINELCAKQTAHLHSILPTAQLRIGDAETMDLDANHSLIISANAIQWFDDPLRFISQSSMRLKTGGQLLLSTFTSNNFCRLNPLLVKDCIIQISQRGKPHCMTMDSIRLSYRRSALIYHLPSPMRYSSI